MKNRPPEKWRKISYALLWVSEQSSSENFLSKADVYRHISSMLVCSIPDALLQSWPRPTRLFLWTCILNSEKRFCSGQHTKAFRWSWRRLYACLWCMALMLHMLSIGRKLKIMEKVVSSSEHHSKGRRFLSSTTS